MTVEFLLRWALGSYMGAFEHSWRLLKYQDYEILEDDTDPGEQRYTNLKVSPLRAFDHYLNYPIEGSISEAEAIRDAIDSPTEQAILDATRQSLDEQGQVDFDNRIGYYEGWSEDPKKPPYSDKVYRRHQISPKGTSTIMPHEFQDAHHEKNLPPIIPYESKAEGYWPGGIYPYDDPSTWYDEDDGINSLERLQRFSDMGIQGAKDFEQKNASEPMDIAFQLLKEDAFDADEEMRIKDEMLQYKFPSAGPYWSLNERQKEIADAIMALPKGPGAEAYLSSEGWEGDEFDHLFAEGHETVPDYEYEQLKMALEYFGHHIQDHMADPNSDKSFDFLDESNSDHPEHPWAMARHMAFNRDTEPYEHFSEDFKEANKSEPMDLAMRLLKEEGQRRTLKPHGLTGLANRLSQGSRVMSFGEGIDDAHSFVKLPLKTLTQFKSDGKQRIGPNPPKPKDESDWHQVAHLPFIDGNEAEGYEPFESESDALKDLMNAAQPIPFADEGFYHPHVHALDYDTNEWVTHLGEDAPQTGNHERIFRAKVMQDGGPFTAHNPIYPDWAWTKIAREQDEGGNHHLTLYTAKYPYSLDELHDNLRENPEPYLQSGAIQFDNEIQTGEPMDIAMRLLKRQTELGEYHEDFPSSHGPVTEYHATMDMPSVMQQGIDPPPKRRSKKYYPPEMRQNIPDKVTYTTPDRKAAEEFLARRAQQLGIPEESTGIVGVRAGGLGEPATQVESGFGGDDMMTHVRAGGIPRDRLVPM